MRAVIDLETTGLDIASDRVVQIAILLPGEMPFVWLVNPGMPIPPGATEIHGITDEMVAEAPPFREIAPACASLLNGATLVGFNSNRFDWPILAEEFARARVVCTPGPKVDVCEIYRRMQPRRLVDAVRHYLGREHEAAHDAEGDALATGEVLLAQLAAHPELAGKDDAELELFSNYEKHLADPAGKLCYDPKTAALCFAFGKHAGNPVLLDAETRQYAEWMMKKDFPLQTKRMLGEALNPPNRRLN